MHDDYRDEPASREWLLSDGYGGYACGTAADLPARRYHGWLVAQDDDGKRRLYVARCDERLLIDGEEHSLLSTAWAGVEAAEGPVVHFDALPWPTFEFTVAGVTLRRELLMTAARGQVLVRYSNPGPAALRFRLRPLLSCREADALTFQNDVLEPSTASADHGASWQPYAGLPPVHLCGIGRAFVTAPCWYRGVELAMDAARGYEHVEDQWNPGHVEIELQPGEARVLAFAVGAAAGDLEAAWRSAAAAAERRAALPALQRGADAFFRRTAGGRLGVLAGFPWFGEWGRDVFVALPGLTLARGDLARCREVIVGAIPFLRDGLLPNVYGSTPADSHYDSADAALWFALAGLRWHRGGAARELVLAELLPALREIAQGCLLGTGLGVKVDDDGLLDVGSPERNATWMDAMIDGAPVTPRHGQPVEIEALWCSLLAHVAELSRLAGAPDAKAWARRSKQAGLTFVRRFWLTDERRLADVWRPDGVDRALRPNMVIAAALELSPLSRQQRAGVVAAAKQHLLTPRGLRTLAPGEAGYQGRYRGGPHQRDAAYHQGTAWPWLFGFFAEASLRQASGSARPKVCREILAWLDDIERECARAGLDHVSEVFDGDLPQAPGGTFAQAWNTGELLRARAMAERGQP